MNHNFLHIPLLLDEGRLQRCFNLPAKLIACDRLFDHPILRQIMGELLGEDYVLSDMAATRIGPQSEPSYWHVDSPFTMVPEPLPTIPMAIAIGWMLDDFTVENGATRVVAGTHLSGKKPPWTYDSVEGEVALTAPAGSLAVWLSQTWHRAGTNLTDSPAASRAREISFVPGSSPSPITPAAPRTTSWIATRPGPATCWAGQPLVRPAADRQERLNDAMRPLLPRDQEIVHDPDGSKKVRARLRFKAGFRR